MTLHSYTTQQNSHTSFTHAYTHTLITCIVWLLSGSCTHRLHFTAYVRTHTSCYMHNTLIHDHTHDTRDHKPDLSVGVHELCSGVSGWAWSELSVTWPHFQETTSRLVQLTIVLLQSQSWSGQPSHMLRVHSSNHCYKRERTAASGEWEFLLCMCESGVCDACKSVMTQCVHCVRAVCVCVCVECISALSIMSCVVVVILALSVGLIASTTHRTCGVIKSYIITFSHQCYYQYLWLLG